MLHSTGVHFMLLITVRNIVSRAFTTKSSSNLGLIMPQGRALLGHYISVLIVGTTVHAQDFRDEEGDRQQGRRTIPIVFPKAGRGSMLAVLLLWTAIVNGVWHTPTPIFASMALLALWVGLRFIFLRTQAEDRFSYLLYNVSRMNTSFQIHI